MEELIGDVGENGGATRGDAALGHQDEESCEELPKVHGGMCGEIGEEIRGEVGRIVRRRWKGGGQGAEAEMMSAKTRLGFGGE